MADQEGSTFVEAQGLIQRNLVAFHAADDLLKLVEGRLERFRAVLGAPAGRSFLRLLSHGRA